MGTAVAGGEGGCEAEWFRCEISTCHCGIPTFFSLLVREKVGTYFPPVGEKSTYNLATVTLRSFGAQGTK